ncbi:hypothetical protein M3Y99_01422800 [Aphelenchoides fujianensis]|nr:hypothetical protein M3Y99_01422800 [Aphelenchoides fujianensis]
MVLSNEQIESHLKALEAEQEKHLKAKNTDGLTACYHKDAVLIHKGHKASYGHAEIKAAFDGFVGTGLEFETKPKYAAASADGEYLIRRGVFTMAGDSREFPFEQIYKKEGGKYLIYHDEFEFEAPAQGQ